MKNLHLLLVEDNEGDVILAKEALTQVNSMIELEVSENGNEALNRLKRRQPFHNQPLPDVVLLDINLPGMNGKELLKIIKTDPLLKHLPVIILSTTNSITEIREVYEQQANWFAIKPDRIEDYKTLFLKIEELIRKKICSDSFESFTIN